MASLSKQVLSTISLLHTVTSKEPCQPLRIRCNWYIPTFQAATVYIGIIWTNLKLQTKPISPWTQFSNTWIDTPIVSFGLTMLHTRPIKWQSTMSFFFLSMTWHVCMGGLVILGWHCVNGVTVCSNTRPWELEDTMECSMYIVQSPETWRKMIIFRRKKMARFVVCKDIFCCLIKIIREGF